MEKESPVKESRIGMLWYDEGVLGERLKRAGEYYAKKYGRVATWARVNERDWVEGEYGIEVKGVSNVLPFHLLIGGDDDNTVD